MQNADSDSARSSFDSVAMRQAAGMPGEGGSSGGDIYSSGQSYDAAEFPVVADIEPNYQAAGLQNRPLSAQTLNMMSELNKQADAAKQSLAAASSQDMAGLNNLIREDHEYQQNRAKALVSESQNEEGTSPLSSLVVTSVEALTKIAYSFKGSKWSMGLTVVIFVCGLIAYNYFSNSTPDASPEVRVVLNCTPIMSFCGSVWAPEWQTCMENEVAKTPEQRLNESRECVEREWNVTEVNATGANATGANSSSV